MAQKYLQSRTPADLIEMGGDAFTLSIARDAGVAWRLRIMAHLEHGAREVGSIYTQPRAISGAPQARVVAAGALPGARGWSVEALCLNPTGTSPNIELDLSIGTSCQLPNFTDLEFRTVSNLAGAAGTVTLLLSQRLRSWTAKATAPGASVTLNGSPAILITPGSSFSQSNLQLWGATLAFVGTSQYVVEVEG
jgi:hypothetical protein